MAKGAETEYYFLELIQKRAPKSYRVEGSGRSKNATKTGKQDSTILEGDLIGIGFLSPENSEDTYFEIKGRKTKKRKTGDPKFSKYMTLEKAWLDQARSEAEHLGLFSIVTVHFKGCLPNNTELKDYTFYNEDSNADHVIIPWVHFEGILDFMRQYQKEGIEKFSNEELIREVKRRLENTND